jgi:hypothetical protein
LKLCATRRLITIEQAGKQLNALSPSLPIHLLVDVILNALATHQWYGALNSTFVLPAVDETGYRRWSKFQEASNFFSSPMFDRLLAGFGIDPMAARKRILSR